MRQKTTLFDQLGYKKGDMSYPTDDQLFLPPNDNKLHRCKSLLHEKPSFFESVISSPLHVITQIVSYQEDNSTFSFGKNLFRVKQSNLHKVIGL